MKLVRLKTDFGFADPEEGFSVTGNLDTLVLQFRDWTNELRSITFTDVMRFVMDIHPVGPKELWPFMDDNNGSIDEVVDSERIAGMREAGDLMPNEEMHHYLVYHNEDEYCEIVASGFTVENGQRVVPVGGGAIL